MFNKTLRGPLTFCDFPGELVYAFVVVFFTFVVSKQLLCRLAAVQLNQLYGATNRVSYSIICYLKLKGTVRTLNNLF